MNELIQELIDQAEQYAFTDGVGIQSQHWRDKFNEKFAELIVEECANFFDKWEKYQIDMSHQVHGVIPPTGGSNKLKEHFGVEQ